MATVSPLPYLLLLLLLLPTTTTSFLLPHHHHHHHYGGVSTITTTTHASFLRLKAISSPASTTTSSLFTTTSINTAPTSSYTVPGAEFLTNERDACGVGFIADLKGKGNHEVLAKSLHALGCMEHRGACSADDVSTTTTTSITYLS